MAVEIHILSGGRLGDRVTIEASRFWAGDHPEYHVYFDPREHPSAEGRSAEFRLSEDGWTIRNTGAGDLFVNHQIVAGTTRLRSGDIVRMSDQGPDFSFSIAKRRERITSDARPPVLPEALAPAAQPDFQQPLEPAAPTLAERPLPASDRPVQTVVPPGKQRSFPGIPIVVAACGATVILTLVVVLVLSLAFGWGRGGRQESVAESSSQEEKTDSAPAESSKNTDVGQDGVEAQKATTSKAASSNSSTAAPPTWENLPERLAGAVLLIKVQQPQTGASWPFATCCAVDKNRLLTTAAVATELAKLRDHGFLILAADGTNQVTAEIEELLVHAAYNRFASSPVQRIYFDLALLKTSGTFPAIADLAEPEDLDSVEEGRPAGCFGFTHDEMKITRFDSFAPQLSRGRIYLVTSLADFPGRPRLMHVKAAIPQNALGSPIVTMEGRVLGVYAETATPDAGLEDLHYAAVIPPELATTLAGQASDLWVPPLVPEDPADVSEVP